MLKKYLSKFAMDILPSVVATIIGAYVVNHYIIAKPAANAPAAAVSTAEPKAESKGAPEATKADSKAPETSSAVTNIPEPGMKAKGISEKAIIERSAVEKPAGKSADKPAETTSVPAQTRRHQPAPRERTAAKPAPAPVQPSAPAAVAAPNTAPPVEAASAPDERRDANDLARAAIERLRGTNDGAPRTQDAARIPDPPRAMSAPPVRPLPAPVMVSTPAAGETFDSRAGNSQAESPQAGSSQERPPYVAVARTDPHRPTPPGEIPGVGPIDLRVDALGPSTRGDTTVAEDVLSAARSVFHAVLPK